MVTQNSIMWRGITGRTYTLHMAMGRSSSIVEAEGVEVLVLEESHLMDDGQSDGNYTPDE